MKKFIKQISFVLIISMVVNFFPANIFSESQQHKIIQELPQEPQEAIQYERESKKDEVKLVGEDISRRDKNVKHFLRDDMSFEAVIYPFSVHYEEDGEWKDIDNTLIETTDDDKNDIFKNKSNDFRVKYPKTSIPKKMVTVTKNDYELSWGIDSNSKSKVSVIEPDTKNEDLSERDKKQFLKNLSTEIIYKDVKPGIDIKYQILPESVKEDIIINSKTEETDFLFNLSVKNVIPNRGDNNTIKFMDEKDPSILVFTIDTPFMYDAIGEISYDVKMDIEQVKKDEYLLTLRPDLEWLNSDERVYPIIIDPYINSSSSSVAVQDSTVYQSNPNTNYGNSVYLHCRKNSNNDNRMTYLRFTLPSLSAADMVTKAELNLGTVMANSGHINVHKVTGSWTESGITWNNRPTTESVVLDYQNPSIGDVFTADITKCAKGWYTGDPNYGVMIKYDDNTNGNVSASFYASEVSGSVVKPFVRIQYVSNAGLESYWTYHSFKVGARAGMLYINNFNGNVVYVHDDIAMSGNRMPISIKHVYNTAYKDFSYGFGPGWMLNIDQRVISSTIGGIHYYIYTDEDGTRHYFKNTGDGYKDESGLNLSLSENIDNTITIRDKMDNTLNFNTSGRLTSIRDGYNNQMTITYNGGRINTVRDGANRTMTFNYNADNNLSQIIDFSGRVWASYQYTGVFNRLESITYADGNSTTFYYEFNGRLKEIRDCSGYMYQIQYNPNAPLLPMTISEKNVDNTLGQVYNIDFGNNQTTFTDYENKEYVYQFNNYGNTTSIRDNLYNAQFYSYYTDEVNRNKIQHQSKLQRSIMNPILNPSAIFANHWNTVAVGGSIGSFSTTLENEFIDDWTFRVTKTNTSGTHYARQNIVLEKGNTYTLSGYLSTSNITKTSGKGAKIFVIYKNSSGNDVTISSPYFNANSDWERTEVIFTLPSNSTSSTISICMGIEGESGMAFFDCLQLEKGAARNNYNIVLNSDLTHMSSFYPNTPADWVKSAACGTSDIWTTYLGNDIPEILDNKCFKIVGENNSSNDKDKYLSHFRPIRNGKKGDVFAVGGWAKAKSVPNTVTEGPISPSDRVFALEVILTKSQNVVDSELIPFNPDCEEWQYVCGRIEASGEYDKIEIRACYYNNANEVYFDGFQIYKESFGTTYVFDDTRGNLESITETTNYTSQYDYDNRDNMTKSVSPDGTENRYNYSDDEKHSLLDIASGENVVAKMDYDSYGNVTHQKTGNGSLFINTSTQHTTDGNYIHKSIDSRGKEVTYNFNTIKGTLSSVVDPKDDNTTYFFYDNPIDLLTTVRKSVDGQNIFNHYSYYYSADMIDTISHNGFIYDFDYDSLLNPKHVKVNTSTLVTNNYEPRTSKLLNSTFGNNQVVGYDYDDLNRVSGIKYNGTTRYKYHYDANGNLSYVQNRLDLGESNSSYSTQRYIYDHADRLENIVETNNGVRYDTKYTYDEMSRISKAEESINGTSNFTTGYVYDRDGNEKQTYYSRYHRNDGTVEYFPLNNSTKGTLGTEAIEKQSVVFENDENNTPTLAMYEGTTNLLGANSSFENGNMAGWTITDETNTGAARIVGDGVDGVYCLEFYDSDNLLNGSDTDAIAYREYELDSPLTQATNFTLSAWVKTIGISGSTKPSFTMICYNSSNVAISTEDRNIDVTDKQWTKAILNNFQAPVNTKRIRVMLRSNAKDREVIRFDAVQLEQKKFATPYTQSTRSPSKVKYTMFPEMSNSSGTMGVWFNTKGFESYRYIFDNESLNFGKLSLYGDISGNLRVIVTNNSNGQIIDLINTGDSKYTNTFNLNNAPNQWHMAALAWSTSGSTLSCTLYIYNNNGVAYTYTESRSGVRSFAGASTTVGSDINGSNHLNGLTGNFFYSSSKLLPVDMQNIYNRGKSIAKHNDYDVLGRIANTSIKNTLFSYERSYSYLNGINGSSTHLINSMESKITTSSGSTNTVTASYEYDDNGNIEKIIQGGNEIEYFYNELNELKRENNQVLNKTILYNYDAGGNITNKIEYAYTKVQNPVNPTRTINYTYDSSWKDKLLTYDGGPTITYDAIGNPLNDGVRTYTWEEGRNLATVTRGTNNLSFKYNDSGIRYEKTVNGVTTRYHLVGDMVTYETNGTDSIYYTYDANGSLISMNLNGIEYFYIRNLQGDIVGIIDSAGIQVVNYTYDTWGKLISMTGSMASTVGAKNPYRYRGYRYDTETELYYLQSRYYNPEWGRFINADNLLIGTTSLRGYNLFQYSYNNPVSLYDPSGQEVITLSIIVGVALVMVIIAFVYCDYTMQGPLTHPHHWIKFPSLDIPLERIATIYNQLVQFVQLSYAKVKKTPKFKSPREWHHMVAKRAPAAEPSRRILKSLHIDIDEPANLIYIKAGLNRRINCTIYYNFVNLIMIGSYDQNKTWGTNRANVYVALTSIRAALMAIDSVVPF
ncbi:UNVERIFIED_CONTAM: LOW QUALITY PROTEIN: RHS repeat-associated protein [Acetivibrio alkalicellulosi]